MQSKKNLIIFKFTHLFLFLMGLAPYRLIISSHSSKKSPFHFRMKYSRLGCVYNISLIFSFVGMTLLVMPDLIAWKSVDPSVFMTVVAGLAILGNIFSIVVIFYYTLNQQQSVNIGNQLSEFDEKFGTNYFNIPNCNTNRLNNIKSWLTILLFIFLWCGVIITSVGIPQSLVRTTSFFIVIILISVVMKYSSTIDNLTTRFSCLNEGFPVVFQGPITTSERLFLVGNATNNRLIIHNFGIFKQARHRLYKITCLISEFYSFPILLTVFYSFCATITTSYVFLRNLGVTNQFTGEIPTFNTIFWFLLCIYPTVALSRSVRIFNMEIRKTAVIIYDLMEKYAFNKEIECQLNNFAVEQIHKTVDFTACGFFSLDCTLLQSIFGAFVTYLLIMLQFNPKEVMQN